MQTGGARYPGRLEAGFVLFHFRQTATPLSLTSLKVRRVPAHPAVLDAGPQIPQELSSLRRKDMQNAGLTFAGALPNTQVWNPKFLSCANARLEGIR